MHVILEELVSAKLLKLRECIDLGKIRSLAEALLSEELGMLEQIPVAEGSFNSIKLDPKAFNTQERAHDEKLC